MRNLQKLLALVLALVMSLALVTVAGAEDYKDVADNADYAEAVDVMSAVGVINGYTDGTFKPEGTLTRAEGAKIVAYMLLGDTIDDMPGDVAPFADVPAGKWFTASIAYLKNQGIVNGRTATTFDPSATLNGYEFAKMLLIALGYEAGQEELTGKGYSINAAKLASTAGVIDGVKISKQPLTRAEAAQMAFNTLTADMVEYRNNTTVVTGDVVVSISGKATKVSGSTEAGKNYDGKKGDGIQQFCEEHFKDLKKTTGDSALTGAPSSRWTLKNDKIGEYNDKADFSYVMDDSMNVDAMLASRDYYDKTGVTVASTGAGAYVNGVAGNGSTVLYKGDIVDIYETDNTVDHIVVTRYTYAKVDKVDTKVSDDQAKNGVSTIITLKNYAKTTIGSTYYDNSTASADDSRILRGYTADYVEGTVLAIALRTDTNAIVNSYVAPIVTGTPTASRAATGSAPLITAGYVTVNGTQYQYTGDAQGVSGIDYDTEYDVYTTAEGYVIGMNGSEKVTLDDVYYVVGFYKVENAYGNKTWYAQAVSLKDGTVSEIKLDSTFSNATESTGFDSMDDVLLGAASGSGQLKVANGTVIGTNATSAEKDVTTALEKKLYVSKDRLYTFNSDGVPAVWNDAKYTKIDDTTAKTVTADFKAGDDRITLGGVKYYVSDDTTFIGVEKFGDDLKVKTATGNMSAKATTEVVAIADGTTVDYVIYVASTLNSADSDELVYVAETPTETTTDGWTAKVYFTENMTAEKTITVEKKGTYASAAPAAGFYKYTVKDDIYTLTATTSDKYGEITGSTITKDTKGWAVGTSITSHRGTMLTGSNSNMGSGSSSSLTWTDVEYGNATVIDTRSSRTGDAYTGKIESVSQLSDAIDLGDVTADVYVRDGEVVFVNVTAVEAAWTVTVPQAVTKNGFTVTVTADRTSVGPNDTNQTVVYTFTLDGTANGTATTFTVNAGSNYSGATALVQGSVSNCSSSTLTITVTNTDDGTPAHGVFTLTGTATSNVAATIS